MSLFFPFFTVFYFVLVFGQEWLLFVCVWIVWWIGRQKTALRWRRDKGVKITNTKRRDNLGRRRRCLSEMGYPSLPVEPRDPARHPDPDKLVVSFFPRSVCYLWRIVVGGLMLLNYDLIGERITIFGNLNELLIVVGHNNCCLLLTTLRRF